MTNIHSRFCQMLRFTMDCDCLRICSCLICQSLQDADGGNVRGQMPLAALRQQRKYQRFEAMYYEHFLEAYYSDYYANYYSSRQQRISTATEMAELSAIMSKSIDRN